MISTWRCDPCDTNWVHAVNFRECKICGEKCKKAEFYSDFVLSYEDSLRLWTRIKEYREAEAKFNAEYAERELRRLEHDWLDSLLC